MHSIKACTFMTKKIAKCTISKTSTLIINKKTTAIVAVVGISPLCLTVYSGLFTCYENCHNTGFCEQRTSEKAQQNTASYDKHPACGCGIFTHATCTQTGAFCLMRGNAKNQSACTCTCTFDLEDKAQRIPWICSGYVKCKISGSVWL